tara:strand:+ start:11553 stop:11864 length:312 start_codon:yes stop_codon:yes gene_type:complete
VSIKNYLFSYGSLQDEKIQLALYNRTLIGSKDKLIGYRRAKEKIASRYPIIFETNKPKDSIVGMVFHISDKELIETDTYEGDFYQRVKIILESGLTAWCYVMQ